MKNTIVHRFMLCSVLLAILGGIILNLAPAVEAIALILGVAR